MFKLTCLFLSNTTLSYATFLDGHYQLCFSTFRVRAYVISIASLGRCFVCQLLFLRLVFLYRLSLLVSSTVVKSVNDRFRTSPATVGIFK